MFDREHTPPRRKEEPRSQKWERGTEKADCRGRDIGKRMAAGEGRPPMGEWRHIGESAIAYGADWIGWWVGRVAVTWFIGRSDGVALTIPLGDIR